MKEQVQELYGNRLRVRSCGILIENEQLLMVNHGSLANGDFWAPPGGGAEFGESLTECVEREFREETGLEVAAGKFLFVCEFIQKPLHAIEIYFLVNRTGGELARGLDPEMEPSNQIIKTVGFLGWNELLNIAPENIHGIFQKVTKPYQIANLSGYFKL